MKNLRKIAMLLAMVLVLSLFGSLTATAETADRVGQRYDFDGSMGRTVADAMILLRHIDGWDDGVIAELDGDVSGDGVISVYDAVCFLKLLLNDTFSMEKSIKIATYNIKAGYYNTGNTISYIAELLKEVDADIVGLQEVDYMTKRSSASGDQLAYLAEAAGYQYYQFTPAIEIGNSKVAASETATSNLYGHGILSKYPITDHEIIHPTQQGLESDGVTAAEYRSIGRYEIDVNGSTLAVYNTHLDFNVGRYQYQEIQDNYMVKDQFAVFMADMNETIPELENNGCINYDRFEILTDNSNIDHIIVSNDTIAWYADETGATGFTVESKTVPEFTYTKNGVDYQITKASDHNLKYSHIMLKY